MRYLRLPSLLCGLFATIFVFLFLTIPASATRGCCSWHGGVSHCDSSVGRYVCSDGTYSPSCGCAIDVQNDPPPLIPTNTPYPTPTPFTISISAKSSYKLDKKTNTYTVTLDWDDVLASEGYSVGISKVAGYDPGPLVDTKTSKWVFTNVKTWTWYANVKVKENGSWSNVLYWKIVLPKVTVTPTGVVKGAKTTVKPTTKPTTNIIVRPTNTPTPFIPTSTPVPTQQPGFTCNCEKTCTQITSCAEAYYQLNTCGCTVRDGDNDGIPCETLCR